MTVICEYIAQFALPMVVGFLLFAVLRNFTTKWLLFNWNILELIGKAFILFAVMYQLIGIGVTSSTSLEVDQLQNRNTINTLNVNHLKALHYIEAVEVESQRNQMNILHSILNAERLITINGKLELLQLKEVIKLKSNEALLFTELQNSFDEARETLNDSESRLAEQQDAIKEDLSTLDLLREENKALTIDLQTKETRIANLGSSINLMFLAWFLVGSFFVVVGRICEMRDEFKGRKISDLERNIRVLKDEQVKSA